MTKKITFIIASNTGASVKRATVSTFKLRLLISLLACGFLFSGVLVFDYFQLKKSSVETDEFLQTITDQDTEIQNQRKQIQLYANEINLLKSKLVDLNNFERKIRIIANIENTIDQSSIFGVGGSAPEDLDINISLEQKHGSLLREMHEQVTQFKAISTKQKTGFQSLLTHLDKQKNLLASTPAVTPTRGWVTSRFGYRKSPFTGLKEFHKGLDIAAKTGTPVIATADGVVAFSGIKGLMGKIITVDHGHGMVTRYAHLNNQIKKQGDIVRRGDVIGEVGNTGRSTGPHLHYDVKLHGISVNPEKYILD
ncbi:MAG: peptidoglycan DD-metalloendopeptidase family protein [Pseudomonadota bacterium]